MAASAPELEVYRASLNPFSHQLNTPSLRLTTHDLPPAGFVAPVPDVSEHAVPESPGLASEPPSNQDEMGRIFNRAEFQQYLADYKQVFGELTPIQELELLHRFMGFTNQPENSVFTQEAVDPSAALFSPDAFLNLDEDMTTDPQEAGPMDFDDLLNLNSSFDPQEAVDQFAEFANLPSPNTTFNQHQEMTRGPHEAAAMVGGDFFELNTGFRFPSVSPEPVDPPVNPPVNPFISPLAQLPVPVYPGQPLPVYPPVNPPVNPPVDLPVNPLINPLEEFHSPTTTFDQHRALTQAQPESGSMVKDDYLQLNRRFRFP